MLFISVFIFFSAAFMLVYGVLTVLGSNKIQMEQRIEQIKDINAAEYGEERNGTFRDRAVAPLLRAVARVFLKVTPGHKAAALNKKLEKAGLLKNSTIERWLYVKGMLVILLPALLGLIAYSLVPNFLKAGLMCLVMMLLVNTAFNFYVSGRIEGRKKLVLRDLPYTLDLITVSVEAGLSFDGAMARVVSNINGELCDEFSKALKEIRMGIQRKIALRNMSDRCDVKELSMLVTSLIQADDLGVSLGKVLRIESSNLREHRKQVAREKAMKAPIKMLFPLIFFIFPTIFIIILGPAVIKIFSIL